MFRKRARCAGAVRVLIYFSFSKTHTARLQTEGKILFFNLELGTLSILQLLQHQCRVKIDSALRDFQIATFQLFSSSSSSQRASHKPAVEISLSLSIIS